MRALLTSLTQRLMDAPMDPEAARGQRRLLGIAATMWGPPLVAAVLGLGARPLVAAFLPVACLDGLARGWHWARTWTTVTLGLGALGGLVGVFAADTIPHRVASAVTALAWALAYAVLARSPEIEAYVAHRRDQRDARELIE